MNKKLFTHVSNKDPESANSLVWFALISECTCMCFCSHICSLLHYIFQIFSRVLFASSTLRNVLKLNQPINELLQTIYCPKSEMKKLLWLGEKDSVVGRRSDPDDKIATDLCSKSTTENRIATGVTSATGPDLTYVLSGCWSRKKGGGGGGSTFLFGKKKKN